MIKTIIYFAYLLIMSVIAFVLYHKDKNMAQGGTAVRIKEKTLLSVAVFGGALGAFFGRILCHHKTNKFYFSFVIYLSLLVQIAIGAFAVYMMMKGM